MNSTDLGTSIVTPHGTEEARHKRAAFKRGMLARKYEVGGQAKVHKVMHEFKHGELHSGAKKGPKVTDRKQAIAIALSEKRRLLAGKYADGGSVAVPPPPQSGSWWQQLQAEIAALTQQSPLKAQAQGAAQQAQPITPNVQLQGLSQQQSQPSSPLGKSRGGRVRG